MFNSENNPISRVNPSLAPRKEVNALSEDLLFDRFTSSEINELMRWSGLYKAIEDKGFSDLSTICENRSGREQRITIQSENRTLAQICMKTAHFRFRLHEGSPRRKLLFIEWLLTENHALAKFDVERLFPGQNRPGLGVFSQFSDFITNLALGLQVEGCFNIPEYFHDALLFHRQFHFYIPRKEAFFRGLLRDLRSLGPRRISSALQEGKVLNQDGEAVEWPAGEMIAILDSDREVEIFSADYYTEVVRELKKIRFHLKPVT